MQILWNALDPNSKQIAVTEKVDGKVFGNGLGYKELCAHIDMV